MSPFSLDQSQKPRFQLLMSPLPSMKNETLDHGHPFKFHESFSDKRFYGTEKRCLTRGNMLLGIAYATCRQPISILCEILSLLD